MPDVGLTHVALTVTDLDASLRFYEMYANMRAVHRRASLSNPGKSVAWISDNTRPFVIVLLEVKRVDHPLLPVSHLGVACESRAEVDRLCGQARQAGVLLKGPTDSGPPVGYWAMLSDPDGHTLELSFGQEVKLTVETSADQD